MIGVIGGSGLYEMDGLEQIEEMSLDTPFGKPSDVYITGVLNGVKMVFLPAMAGGTVCFRQRSTTGPIFMV